MRPPKSIHSTYEFLGLAGSGQYGQVYCARRRSTHQIVALKELPLHRFSTHALLRELRFLLMLDHPNLTRCEALEHALEGRYLVLEYCEGGTLRDWLEQRSPLQFKQILHWIGQILLGLEHAHQAGVIHCDVKPENVLLRLTANGWQMKLTDFGIAKGQRHTAEDLSVTGSAAYMAPERFYGQFSPGVDIYAVGVMLYEMLLGSRPFSGSPGQLMHDHLNRRVALAPELPALVRPILQRALEKLPARRYGSAAQMLGDIDAILPQIPEPLACWVGPLLPPGSLQLEAAISLPSLPQQVLAWQGHYWWWQGSQVWRTDPQGEHSTLIVTLNHPLQHLAAVDSGLVIMTTHHLYHWVADQPLALLREFRDPWRWQMAADHLVWATPREYGLIRFAPVSPVLPHAGRSFYHQVLPQPLPEPPLIWSNGHHLTFGIQRRGGLDLYQQPLIPWQPLDWQHPPFWSLPIPIRQGIPIGGEVVLVPTDPRAALVVMSSHPLRLHQVDLPLPWQGISATPTHLQVVTQAQHLILYGEGGEGLSQTVLPQPFHSFDALGSLWLSPSLPKERPYQLWHVSLEHPE